MLKAVDIKVPYDSFSPRKERHFIGTGHMVFNLYLYEQTFNTNNLAGEKCENAMISWNTGSPSVDSFSMAVIGERSL